MGAGINGMRLLHGVGSTTRKARVAGNLAHWHTPVTPHQLGRQTPAVPSPKQAWTHRVTPLLGATCLPCLLLAPHLRRRHKPNFGRIQYERRNRLAKQIRYSDARDTSRQYTRQVPCHAYSFLQCHARRRLVVVRSVPRDLASLLSTANLRSCAQMLMNDKRTNGKQQTKLDLSLDNLTLDPLHIHCLDSLHSCITKAKR